MAPELRIPSLRLCMAAFMLFWTQKLIVIVAFEVIAKGVNISVSASGAPSRLIPLSTQIGSSRRIPTVQRCWWICTDEERCHEALHDVLTALSTVN